MINNDEWDVELYVDWNLDEIRRKENERIDHIVANMCNLEIVFDMDENNTSTKVALPKSLILHSSLVRKHVESRDTPIFVTMNGDHLQVDPKKIIRLLLAKENVEIRPTLLGDYFIFFHSLRLEKEKMDIITRIRGLDKFETLFDVFIEFCERFESENIKYWVMGREYENLNFEFLYSFTLGLFFQMKKKQTQVKDDQPFFLKASFMKYYLRKYHFKRNFKREVFLHKNFDQSFEHVDFSVRLEKTFNDGLFTNLTLETKDGGTFGVHKEILVWRSDFFFRLLCQPQPSTSFEWSEGHQARTEGKVDIIDLNKSTLETLLRYIYTGKITNRKIEVLFPLLDFFGKHLMLREFGFVFDILKEVMFNQSLENVENIIHDYAFIFCETKQKQKNQQQQQEEEESEGEEVEREESMSEEEKVISCEGFNVGKYFTCLCCVSKSTNRSWVLRKIKEEIHPREQLFHFNLLEKIVHEHVKKVEIEEILLSRLFSRFERFEYAIEQRKILDIEQRENELEIMEKNISSRKKELEMKESISEANSRMREARFIDWEARLKSKEEELRDLEEAEEENSTEEEEEDDDEEEELESSTEDEEEGESSEEDEEESSEEEDSSEVDESSEEEEENEKGKKVNLKYARVFLNKTIKEYLRRKRK